eukprot:7198865-Prymnesium_polylepis.1
MGSSPRLDGNKVGDEVGDACRAEGAIAADSRRICGHAARQEARRGCSGAAERPAGPKSHGVQDPSPVLDAEGYHGA